MRSILVRIAITTAFLISTLATTSAPASAYALANCESPANWGGVRLFDNDGQTGANRTLCIENGALGQKDQNIGVFSCHCPDHPAWGDETTCLDGPECDNIQAEPWNIHEFDDKANSMRILDNGGDACDTVVWLFVGVRFNGQLLERRNNDNGVLGPDYKDVGIPDQWDNGSRSMYLFLDCSS
jgi:hypothetical protein